MSMLSLMWGVLVLGIFSAFSSFIFEKHLLCLLLSLELVVMMLFSMILCVGEFYMSLVYLVMGVCEGAVGISLLVMLSRSMGGYYVGSYSLSRC